MNAPPIVLALGAGAVLPIQVASEFSRTIAVLLHDGAQDEIVQGVVDEEANTRRVPFDGVPMEVRDASRREPADVHERANRGFLREIRGFLGRATPRLELPAQAIERLLIGVVELYRKLWFEISSLNGQGRLTPKPSSCFAPLPRPGVTSRHAQRSDY